MRQATCLALALTAGAVATTLEVDKTHTASVETKVYTQCLEREVNATVANENWVQIQLALPETRIRLVVVPKCHKPAGSID